MNDQNITAMILAGGMGIRLRSIIKTQKVIAAINDKPFICFLLDQLFENGFNNVIICTGYQSDQVEKIIGNANSHLHIAISKEDIPLGTAGAARKALDRTNSENLLIMNGDSFCDVNLRDFYGSYLKNYYTISIVVTKMNDVSRYGHIEIDKQNRIIQFVEKSPTKKSGWISAGIYLFKRRLLASLPLSKKLSFEFEVLPNWLTQGIFAYQHKGRFIDIGTPASLKEAQSFFSDK